jgi:hypothetical protein
MCCPAVDRRSNPRLPKYDARVSLEAEQLGTLNWPPAASAEVDKALNPPTVGLRAQCLWVTTSSALHSCLSLSSNTAVGFVTGRRWQSSPSLPLCIWYSKGVYSVNSMFSCKVSVLSADFCTAPGVQTRPTHHVRTILSNYECRYLFLGLRARNRKPTIV